jgi:hypothetical protein
MSYWTQATSEQLQQLTALCQGKHVLDIGGYDASLASKLIDGGAKSVTVLDKERPLHEQNRHPGKITCKQQTFEEFLAADQHTWEVGVISWPVNNDYAMRPAIEILKRCKEVAYMGCNLDGTQCGTQLLWQYLTTRKRIKNNPTRRNSLLTYAAEPRHSNQPLAKEEEIGIKGTMEFSL